LGWVACPLPSIHEHRHIQEEERRIEEQTGLKFEILSKTNTELFGLFVECDL